jgi:hypothetical protein
MKPPSLVALYMGAVAALAGIRSGAATALKRPVVDFLQQPHDRPPRRREARLHGRLARMSHEAAKGYFLKRDEAGPRWRAYRKSHSAPFFIAHVRDESGHRRPVQVASYDEALARGPYLIERVNGFGQVTQRWRSEPAVLIEAVK